MTSSTPKRVGRKVHRIGLYQNSKQPLTYENEAERGLLKGFLPSAIDKNFVQKRESGECLLDRRTPTDSWEARDRETRLQQLT